MNASDLPDEIVQIVDDADAQVFLATCGILDQLLNKSRLSNLDGRDVNTIAICHYNHPTHWILAFRFHGMEDESENGFVVNAWPKSKWPRTILEDAIKAQNLGNPDDVEHFRGPDNSN